MQSYEVLSNRIEAATKSLLGSQPASLQIHEWVEQYRAQSASIMDARGVALPSIAIVGAKGQGKTWIARQFVLDKTIAALLPSGVLSQEATTQLYWLGSRSPEGIDSAREIYIPCRAEGMLNLSHPYILLDTPGTTDDDSQAAKIAKEALTLSPIKLLVIRRDQLRSAVVGNIALHTEGSICIPVITCVPRKECGSMSGSSEIVLNSSSLTSDLATLDAALRSVAPGTRFLPAILIEDFEATGDEEQSSIRFRVAIQTRLRNESLDSIAATRTNRLTAASLRLRTRIEQLLESQLPNLAKAVRQMHQEADSLPKQTIDAVLGSTEVLQAAVRARLRAQLLNNTAMIWFPYRTVLSVLGFTSGAWDRLIMSFTGSVPSIFGTFVAWAKNLQQTRSMQWDLNEGIRDRLHRQIEDRLAPVQASFYRSIARLRGENFVSNDREQQMQIRLTGVEELQSRARATFENCVDRELGLRIWLQCLGLFGTLLFWGMLAGPIVAIYRLYFQASWQALASQVESADGFAFSGSVIGTSLMLSFFPLLVYCMLVFSWQQRGARVRRIARITLAEEHKLVEELKNQGVIRLQYDDPMLEHAEFLVNLKS
ncbi:MAG: hypothetical protein ACK57V_08340 [Pirellula sp.]